ncbi:hypothetical protein HPB48_005316 [Haemaphysalis longicornis]|uniref:Uncharacterized protein n=1 Tax=Haemaphysalis longicornis TaxID=44386 RepID=A0A9J6GGR8_HAELO|nr:hypothetical protein HPB48_005316 [Haemaphysalis longicornis]
MVMRQVGLLAAGCQTWHVNVACFSGHRFAYAATLAIYIYEVRKRALPVGLDGTSNEARTMGPTLVQGGSELECGERLGRTTIG